MWPTSLAKPSKRPPLKRAVDDGDDWFSKGVDDMRARHPVFRMPNWMSDDNDVSNLASRISHSPHFSSLGRRGNPWRERRNSGGSAMSGGSEEDCVDSHHPDRSAVRIPIRIEAEAPPGYEPVPPQQSRPQLPQNQSDQNQQESQSSHPDPAFQPPHNVTSLKKQPSYASKTTSAVDALKQEVPRTTRCSSAPPDMNEQIAPPHRFVSKTTIIPQNPAERTLSTSPVFNNIAKPFVSPHKTQESSSPAPANWPENQQDSHFSHQKQHPGPEFQQQTQPQNQFYQSAFPQQSPPHQFQQPYSYPQHQHSQQPYNQQHQSRQPHQQWDNAGHKSSIVRNIPIIFEGRDEDKRSDSSACSKSPPNAHETSKQQQQHQQQQQQSNRPQRDNFYSSNPGFAPSHGYSSNSPSTHPHQFEHPHTHPQPQQHFFQRPQQSPSQPTKEATPPPPEPKDIKMDKIATVRESVSKLQEKVKNFEGHEKNKEFLYIDEMLTRALLQLDDIDPDGRDDVRQARRTLIKDINATISSLEKLVSGPLPDPKSVEVVGSGEPEEMNKQTQEQQTSSSGNEVKDSEQQPVKSPSQPKLTQPEEVTDQIETQTVINKVESKTPNPAPHQQTPNEEIPHEMQCDEQNSSAVENDGKNKNVDPVSSEIQSGTDDKSAEISDPNKPPLT